jgi:hypothetical protein
MRPPGLRTGRARGCMTETQVKDPVAIRKSVKLTAAAVVTVVAVLALELMGYVVSQKYPQYFDSRARVLEDQRITPEVLSKLAINSYSQKLGWGNPRSTVLNMKNCIGEKYSFSYDDSGFPVYKDNDDRDPSIIIGGDSYAHGDENRVDQSFPFLVQEDLRVRIINAAVPGYGADQALLRLLDAADKFPHARILVLSIMHEDVFRVLNSYRPAYADNNAGWAIHRFKPYFDEKGVFVANKITENVIKDETEIRAEATRAFDTDFFRRPIARFPYSIALARALVSRGFQIDLLASISRHMGRGIYDMPLQLAVYRRPMTSIFRQFADEAEKRGMNPVVLLIPKNGSDHGTGQTIKEMADNNDRRRLIFVDISAIDFNWSTFNLRPDGDCHPSPTGHRFIADTLAQSLRPLLPGLTPPGPRPHSAHPLPNVE